MKIPQTKKCLRCGAIHSYRLDHRDRGVIRIGCEDCGHITRQRPLAGSRQHIVS